MPQVAIPLSVALLGVAPTPSILRDDFFVVAVGTSSTDRWRRYAEVVSGICEWLERCCRAHCAKSHALIG